MEAPSRLLIGILVLAMAAPATAASKEVLAEFFTSNGAYFKLNAKNDTLEVCSDLCEYYEMKSGASAEAWDTVFLHQYYFVAPNYREEFRERYASEAKALVEKYAKLCPNASAERVPSCVLKQLGARNRVEFASVRYDEGYRCQVAGRLTEPTYQGKSTCTKVKHAS